MTKLPEDIDSAEEKKSTTSKTVARLNPEFHTEVKVAAAQKHTTMGALLEKAYRFEQKYRAKPQDDNPGDFGYPTEDSALFREICVHANADEMRRFRQYLQSLRDEQKVRLGHDVAQANKRGRNKKPPASGGVPRRRKHSTEEENA